MQQKTLKIIIIKKKQRKRCAAQRYMLALRFQQLPQHIENYIHRSVCIKISLLLMQYDEDPSRIS